MILDLIQVKRSQKKKRLMKRLNGIIRCCRKFGGDKIYFLCLSFSLTRNANSCFSCIPMWINHINSICMDDEIGLVHLLMIHGGSQNFRTEACHHCHIFLCLSIYLLLFVFFFVCCWNFYLLLVNYSPFINFLEILDKTIVGWSWRATWDIWSLCSFCCALLRFLQGLFNENFLVTILLGWVYYGDAVVFNGWKTVEFEN